MGKLAERLENPTILYGQRPAGMQGQEEIRFNDKRWGIITQLHQHFAEAEERMLGDVVVEISDDQLARLSADPTLAPIIAIIEKYSS